MTDYEKLVYALADVIRDKADIFDGCAWNAKEVVEAIIAKIYAQGLAIVPASEATVLNQPI